MQSIFPQRLKESYVLALQFCGKDLASEQFLALLEKFPSQRELQRASPTQLEKWLPKQRRAADDPPGNLAEWLEGPAPPCG